MKLREDAITWREIDGELVILDLRSSIYLTTNRTGTTLLHLLVDERSHEELVAALTDGYDIPRDTAERDVTTFLGLLRERDLLGVSAPRTVEPDGARA